jgi:hypothetical protein
MSVGFKVDSNVEMSRRMMKMLDTGWDAVDLDSSLTVSARIQEEIDDSRFGDTL